MSRKQRMEGSYNESLMNLKASTPLEKMGDMLTVDDIIKNDQMMFEIQFMSQMMVENRTVGEIRVLFDAKFHRELTNSQINTLKKKVRLVYKAQIAQNRDEMVAEELMHEDWELRELKDYWERSKQGKRKSMKHRAQSVGDPKAGTDYTLNEETDNEEETIGDLEAMKRIASIRERRIKLLGIEAPKQEAENKRVGAININIVDKPRTIEVTDVQPVEVEEA